MGGKAIRLWQIYLVYDYIFHDNGNGLRLIETCVNLFSLDLKMDLNQQPL